MGNRAATWLAGGIMLVVGLVFTGVGATQLLAERSFEQGAQATTGHVIRMERSGDGTSAPVVEYSAAGVLREVKGTVYSSPPDFAVGDEVRVLYRADKAVIDSFVERYLFGTIFGGLGSVSALVGIGLVAFSVLRWRRQQLAPLPITLAQSEAVAASLASERLKRGPPERPGSFALAFAAVLLPMGLAFTAGGLWSVQQTRGFIARTVPAVGVIVDEHQWRSGFHTPIVEVRRASGDVVRLEPDLSDWKMGDRVPVRYADKPPYEVRIDGFVDLWLVPTVFASVGLLLTLGGVALVIAGFRARNRPVSPFGLPLE